MPELTADVYSVEQTIANALEDDTSATMLVPGVWANGKYVGTYDLSASPAVDNGDTIGMVTLPPGVIVTSMDILITTTLGSSTIAIGTTVTAAKYHAALVMTSPLIQWVPYMVGTQLVTQMSTPLATRELVLITVGAANMPTSSGDLICLRVNVLEP